MSGEASGYVSTIVKRIVTVTVCACALRERKMKKKKVCQIEPVNLELLLMLDIKILTRFGIALYNSFEPANRDYNLPERRFSTVSGLGPNYLLALITPVLNGVIFGLLV